jgi:hypothetical protein
MMIVMTAVVVVAVTILIACIHPFDRFSLAYFLTSWSRVLLEKLTNLCG